MKVRMESSLILFLLLLVIFHLTSALKNCSSYDDRKSHFIDFHLDKFQDTFLNLSIDRFGDLLVLQAYRKESFTEEALENSLDHVKESKVADFAIVRLVRALYFMDGTQNSERHEEAIVEALNSIPYWLPDRERPPHRQYWSENHIILWSSSDWLLHERYAREIRGDLRSMIVKFLDVKIEYGYNEFFSPMYSRFTLAALLNLVDFCKDEEIRDKASSAVGVLLEDTVLLLSARGSLYSSSGRAEMINYQDGNSTYLARMAQLITGVGGSLFLDDPNINFDDVGSIFLATSTWNATDVCESWSDQASTEVNYGFPLSKSKRVFEDVNRETQVMFDKSAGSYLTDAVWFLDHFELWDHEEFFFVQFLEWLPTTIKNAIINVIATVGYSLTGSFIGNSITTVYKNDGVVLTSSRDGTDLWQGKKGWQAFPIVATIEDICIILRSGTVYKDWYDMPKQDSNLHMPRIQQVDNVAMIMYKPNFDLLLLGMGNVVALKWDPARFDEELDHDLWRLGRIKSSYVAVRFHCHDKDVGDTRACANKLERGQTWAIVVGNENTHGSFDSFATTIRDSVYEERWDFDWTKLSWEYYGHVNVDGKDIEYHWS